MVVKEKKQVQNKMADFKFIRVIFKSWSKFTKSNNSMARK